MEWSGVEKLDKSYIGPPKKDRKQSIKNKNNSSLSFHFDFLGLWLCDFVRFFRIFGCSLISHELLDKTYIYAHYQNELNEGIKMMCFICCFGVYFPRNHRKCSQNGEDGNFKMQIYEANDISPCRA